MRRRIVVLAIIFFLFLVALFVFYHSPSPQNIRITNVTDRSLSISWTTKRPARGWVVYNYSQVADEVENPSTVHHLTLRNLEPETVYSYRIRSGFWLFGGGKAKTAPLRKKHPSSPNPVYGKVVKKDGFTPAFPVIVYLGRLSALTNQAGNWTMDLGEEVDKQVKIFCQGGSLGEAEMSVKADQMRPTPLLILR